MNQIKIYVFLLLAIGCFSCDFTSSNDSNINGSNTSEVPSKVATKAVIEKMDFVCIPNQRVGKITSKFSEEDIINAYGKENVTRKEIGIGEGETAKGTIVFPDSKNELIVEWDSDALYNKIKKIRIEKPDAQWTSVEGIKVGSSLDDLHNINGKEFKFYGFEWDFGGVTNDWNEGKVNKQLVVFLHPENPKAIYPDLLGDQLISSKHPKATEADLRVNAMSIYFGL